MSEPSTYAPLDATSSRRSELMYLERWIYEAGTGSYLAALLSPALVQYTRDQIEADLAPNVWELVRTTRDEAAMAVGPLNATAEERQAQVEALQRGFTSAQERAATLTHELRGLRSAYENLEDELNKALRDRDESAALTDTSERLQYEAERERDQLQRGVAATLAIMTGAWLKSETIRPDDLRDALVAELGTL